MHYYEYEVGLVRKLFHLICSEWILNMYWYWALVLHVQFDPYDSQYEMKNMKNWSPWAVCTHQTSPTCASLVRVHSKDSNVSILISKYLFSITIQPDYAFKYLFHGNKNKKPSIYYVIFYVIWFSIELNWIGLCVCACEVKRADFEEIFFMHFLYWNYLLISAHKK